MITDYKARKNEVLQCYENLDGLMENLESFAQKNEWSYPSPQVRDLMDRIRSQVGKIKEDKFSMMIAGEAKSGKSTFINAFLGLKLLPMDVKQCTSAIVEIKYGNSFSVKATYADDRVESIIGDDAVRKFLKDNAALDDDYRDIPVPSINAEILVKSGKRALEQRKEIYINPEHVKDLLDAPEIQAANIHNIPNYNERIKEYIENKKHDWKNIVTKIEVFYPFGEELRGIEIVDSPGVCARGGVSEITSKYIEKADAIIFLKPVSGQALESAQFNEFMKNVSVARNKNALFLVLTRATNVTEAELKRLKEEAEKQFSGLNEQNLLIVDSKAEMYAKELANVENIEVALRRLNDNGELDDFVLKAYQETHGFLGSGNFIDKLKEKARFSKVYNSLNTFGRKAHYILLFEMLNNTDTLYDVIYGDLQSMIDMLHQKAEDPTKLAIQICETKNELESIRLKIRKDLDKVVKQFKGDKTGLILRSIEDGRSRFKNAIENISPGSYGSFDELERASLTAIDEFKKLTNELQMKAVEAFDKALIELSDKSTIRYQSLKPNFDKDTFRQIKEATEVKAEETEAYEEGLTFIKTKYRSYYSKDKHFSLIKNNILERMDKIRNDLSDNLFAFVEMIKVRYTDELIRNAEAKKREMDALADKKESAEQIKETISELEKMKVKFKEVNEQVVKIKGGIEEYV